MVMDRTVSMTEPVPDSSAKETFEASVARRPVNALSVDIEDYFQVYAFSRVIDRADWPHYPSRVEANTDRILALFEEAGAKATFFTLGMIAERFPTLIRRIADQGHELASHGWEHYHVFEQDRKAFAADVERTKKTLEDVGGVAVNGYRAASFSINQNTWWAYDALAAAGHRYSSSVNPIKHDHYGVPNAPRFAFRPGDLPLVEIPVSTREVAGRRLAAGGGGYFRLLPYAWFRHNIRRLNTQEGASSIFYFHPWEVDPDQPRINGAPAKARFRHYVNLDRMAAKLQRLLHDFAWDRVDHVFPMQPDGLPVWRP
mgnify:CR=1 FL=1